MRVVLSLIVSKVADMVVSPWAKLLARPMSLIVATAVLVLNQVTRVVISAVESSE